MANSHRVDQAARKTQRPGRLSAARASGAILIGAALVVGCAHFNDEPRFEVLEGSVTFRDTAALPAGSVAVIQLQEIGADGTVSSEIAETTVENIQGAPVGFSLRYDARNLVPDHRYVINATISEGQHRLLELPQGQPVYVGHLPKSVLLVLDRAAPSAAGKPNH